MKVDPKLWEDVEISPNMFQDPRYTAAIKQMDHSRIFDTAAFVVSSPLSLPADLFLLQTCFPSRWPPCHCRRDSALAST
jgi:hypothetical protein